MALHFTKKIYKAGRSKPMLDANQLLPPKPTRSVRRRGSCTSHVLRCTVIRRSTERYTSTCRICRVYSVGSEPTYCTRSGNVRTIHQNLLKWTYFSMRLRTHLRISY